MIEFLMYIGRAICHQIPERSLFINGLQMPVCARDTGIYIGIFSSLLYLLFSKKHKANMIPTIPFSFALLLLLIPMVYDGLSSYLHLRETTNIARMWTGISFGIAIPFFLIPLLNFKSEQQTTIRVLNKGYEIIIPILISSGIGFVIYKGSLPYMIAASLIVGTLIVWTSLLAYALIRNIKRLKNNILKIIVSVITALLLLSALSVLFGEILSTLLVK